MNWTLADSGYRQLDLQIVSLKRTRLAERTHAHFRGDMFQKLKDTYLSLKITAQQRSRSVLFRTRLRSLNVNIILWNIGNIT